MAVALTTTSCSLQDYAYLGAGVENTDTTDDETSDETGETDAPDASDTNITTDTTETDLDASSPFEAGGSDEDAGDATGVVDTTDTTLDADVTDVSTETTDITSDVDGGPPLPPLVVEGNLIPNSSFENPIGTEWSSFGQAVNAVVDHGHTGVRSLLSTNRKELWQGPALKIRSLLTEARTYRARAWVLDAEVDGDAPAISMSFKWVCLGQDGGPLVEYYDPAVATVASKTTWRELDAVLDLDYLDRDCEFVSLEMYFEGPPIDTDFYVDDVSLVPL